MHPKTEFGKCTVHVLLKVLNVIAIYHLQSTKRTLLHLNVSVLPVAYQLTY